MTKACAIVSSQETRMRVQEAKHTADHAVVSQQTCMVINAVYSAMDKSTKRALANVKFHLSRNTKSVGAVVKCGCPQILHAILLILHNENVDDILNVMSVSEIQTLRKLVSDAVQKPCPDTDKLQKMCDRANDANIKAALQVSCMIAVFWDDAVVELNKWSNAIDDNLNRRAAEMAQATEAVATKEQVEPTVTVVERKKRGRKPSAQPKVKAPVAKSDGYTRAQLAEILGIGVATLHRIQQNIRAEHPELAAKMDSWFIRSNGTFGVSYKLLKSDCLEDFKALIAPYIKRPRKKSDASKQLGQPVADAKITPDVITCPTVKIDGLSGVKALEALIKSWTALLGTARDNAKKADKAFQAAVADLGKTNDPIARDDLIVRMRRENTNMIKYSDEIAEITSRIERANAYLNEMRVAQQALDQKKAQIASFLAEYGPNNM